MEGAPYALGPSLVELIAADGGNDAVDEAFDDPPATTEHMVDPRSYFAGDSAHEVTAPVVPTGGERIGEHDRLGALPLFLLLSERVRALPFHQLVQANESAEPSAAIVTAIERAVSDCRVAWVTRRGGCGRTPACGPRPARRRPYRRPAGPTRRTSGLFPGNGGT
jgi:hypothetical protein